ncbi:MAG: flagellar export protein FliJ [Alphaproteobacteria bacterium]
MSKLPVLVRLHRRRLGEARGNLAACEAAREELSSRLAAFHGTMNLERRATRGSLEATRVYPAFAERMRSVADALARAIAEADVAVDQASELLAARFRELKTYELALEAEAEKQRSTEARRERSELDEIAADRARRTAAAR